MTNIIFSVDLDWVPGSDIPMIDLFDIFERHQIKPAMFFTAGYAQQYPSIMKTAIDLKYNIGAHGLLHGFDWMENFGRDCETTHKKELVSKMSKILKSISGIQPTMFRAPNLKISEDLWDILIEAGYKIDSSVPSKRFDFYNGSVNNLKYFAAPSSPYVIYRKTGQILEIPPSAFILPLNMRFICMFPINIIIAFTKMISAFYPYVVVYIHPMEFIKPELLTLNSGYPIKFFEHCNRDNLIILEKFIEELKKNDFQYVQMSEVYSKYLDV